MQRTTTALVALIVAVAFVGAVPFAAAAQAGADSAADEARPGEKLSGVIGVQNAEFEGEVDERAYGLKVAKAASDEERADVAAEQIDDVEQRVADLEQRLQDLEEARESGEISDGEYNAEVATAAAEKKTAERLAEQSDATAGELPEDVLQDKIDLDALLELREKAGEVGGDRISEIAQSIAGPDVGERMSDDASEYRPDDVPVDGASDNDTDRDDRPDGVGN